MEEIKWQDAWNSVVPILRSYKGTAEDHEVLKKYMEAIVKRLNGEEVEEKNPDSSSDDK